MHYGTVSQGHFCIDGVPCKLTQDFKDHELVFTQDFKVL